MGVTIRRQEGDAAILQVYAGQSRSSGDSAPCTNSGAAETLGVFFGQLQAASLVHHHKLVLGARAVWPVRSG